MPTYNSSISLTGDKYLPGDDLEGKVIYTASKDCTLKDAKLQLECSAYYYHQENRRHTICHSPVSIPLSLKDEGIGLEQTIQREEKLNGDNKSTVFKFKTTLPKDLLPTTREGGGNTRGSGRVLDVFYTLVLSSKRGFLSRFKKDASITITVLDTFDVNGEPFIPNQVAVREVSVTDARLGRRMDMLTTASVPRLTWERGEILQLTLHVARMSTINTHIVTSYLERTIGYKDMQTITDVGVSRAMELKDNSAPFSFEMAVRIPGDAIHSGVISCPSVSVHYRIRVEIKTTCNNLPAFTMGLPIIVGRLPQRLAPESSGHDDGSMSDRRRPAQPYRRRPVVKFMTVYHPQGRPRIINQPSERVLGRTSSDNKGQQLPPLHRRPSAVYQPYLEVTNPSSQTSEVSSYSFPTSHLRQPSRNDTISTVLMESRRSRAQWEIRTPGRHHSDMHEPHLLQPSQGLSSICEETGRKVVITSGQHNPA